MSLWYTYPEEPSELSSTKWDIKLCTKHEKQNNTNWWTIHEFSIKLRNVT